MPMDEGWALGIGWILLLLMVALLGYVVLRRRP
jgi:hypothetical protein